MPIGRNLVRRAQRFARADEGGITILALFIFMAMMIVIGIAIDTSRLQLRATMLQVTADTAAFAAAQKLVFSDTATATGVALQSAQANMPVEEYGHVLLAQDVEWGVWDSTARVFRTGAIIGTATPNAVRVTTRQTQANGNPFTNILLGWVGVPTAQPVRVAVATTETDLSCPEGFLSKSRVDIQSNNKFYNGFCLYASGTVEIQSNGTFANGVKVIAPTGTQITYQNGNVGIEQALGTGTRTFPEVDALPRIVESLRYNAATSPFVPSYVTNRTVQTLTQRNLSSAQLVPGGIYLANNCPLRIDGVIDRVVLITDCEVDLRSDVVWGSSLLATTNTAVDSIDGSTGMWIGAPGGCAAGKQSQILTLGGIKTPSKLNADGAQMIAMTGVSFTGLAGALSGVNVISAGTISGTSNMDMALCGGTGMSNNIRVPTARMVL
jgi:Flp pilus assembly protein TadG